MSGVIVWASIEDPASAWYWVFKFIANGFVALVFGRVVLALLRSGWIHW